MSSKLIRFFWWLLAPFLVATLLIAIFLMVLETKKIKRLQVEDEKISYMYSFPKFFNNTIKPKIEFESISEVEKFDNLILKVCYLEKDREFVMVKEDQTTFFINLNEDYKGAKLVDITKDSAKFFKNGKYVFLTLEQSENSVDNTKNITKRLKSKQDNYIGVNRTELKKYKKNIKKALRDIRFQEVIEDDRFAGLRLNFIRKGSLFDKMGFKKGDIIKSVDSKNLDSIMDLLPYYTSLENITTLQISFARNKQIKEIIYEIN